MLLVTDVYGEALADDRIMAKQVLLRVSIAAPYVRLTASKLLLPCSRLNRTSRPVVIAVKKIYLKPHFNSIPSSNTGFVT
jgi:hypothetical protein